MSCDNFAEITTGDRDALDSVSGSMTKEDCSIRHTSYGSRRWKKISPSQHEKQAGAARRHDVFWLPKRTARHHPMAIPALELI